MNTLTGLPNDDGEFMSDLPLTRQSLLIELGKRNEMAWAEFLEVYEAAIVRYCRSRGLQEADAMDAAQEVYAAIHQRMSTWDHDPQRGKFRAWLFRVARNITVDLIEMRAKQKDAANQSLSAKGFADCEMQPTRLGNANLECMEGQSSAFRLEWRRAMFEWAADQVKREVREITWQAFCLTAIEGRKAEDVAVELEVPVGSIYTSKCRVMNRIREKIANIDDECPNDEHWT